VFEKVEDYEESMRLLDIFGFSALDYARLGGHAKTFSLLLDYGATCTRWLFLYVLY